ncbi:amidohydrolase [Tissierella creatinini]|nr:amidohydrolase [Tissierella creatinini]TJX64340.1 amidohydrolase [Soehngenia saccharolytica]
MLFKNISLVDENFNIKKNMNLVTVDEVITYIGSEVPQEYNGEVYDGNNKVILPGFYNTHCHIPMTLLRGYGEGLPLQRWLFEKVFPFEARLSGEDCYWGTMHGAIELIKSGVASFTDMYFFIEDIIRAVEESGLKGNISHGSTFNPDIPDFYDLKAYQDPYRLLKIYNTKASGRIKIDASLHAEYTSNEAFVRQVAEFAKENNLIIHTHVSETLKEHEECKQRHGLTPFAYLNKCGLLDQPVVAAHCVWIEGEDFDIMKEKNVTSVHNISSNMKLGSGFAPIREMLDKGIRVGLGTDGASSNNNLNFMEEIHLASIINKGVNRDPEFLQPSQILRMATENGAISQGRFDAGKIRVGYKADLIVIDMDKPHLQPVFDVLANLVYSAQSEDICLSMIDGKLVYKDGEVLNIDVERTVFESNRIKDRILSEI